MAGPEVASRSDGRVPATEVIGVTHQNRCGATDSVLTSGELMILALDGLCFDSVAARVAVSPRTLRRRLRSVCKRLGLAHPVQAIVWAARRGLI